MTCKASGRAEFEAKTPRTSEDEDKDAVPKERKQQAATVVRQARLPVDNPQQATPRPLDRECS